MLGEIREADGAGDKEIRIALGPYEDCVYTRRGYIDKRRSYLAKLGNVQEFSEFMGSCFRETVFSDDIKQKIPKFRKCTEAIVSNLSLLNDQALDIYKKHNGDANAAMRELTAKAVECSGDPGHKEFLKFPFSYSEKESDGREYVKVKKITCSPHMKLIRRDSNFVMLETKSRESKVLITRYRSLIWVSPANGDKSVTPLVRFSPARRARRSRPDSPDSGLKSFRLEAGKYNSFRLLRPDNGDKS